MRFECDWCRRLKEPDEDWILGFAAENLGVTASRREVTVLNAWDLEQAVHPFAVHFCSVSHKDNYMSALFDTELSQDPRPAAVTAPKRKHASRRRVS